MYKSIQGESIWQGLPCLFIRVAGCNLKCEWCDTKYAQDKESGTELTIKEIISAVDLFNTEFIEITGGEPLLYMWEVVELTKNLVAKTHHVLIETNGSIRIPDELNFHNPRNRIHFIVDVKCPSSRMSEHNYLDNLELLSKFDNLKFVIADREDYEYAKQILESNTVRCDVIFMPVWNTIKPSQLAHWILNDELNVRLQVQLHKIMWGDMHGV